MNIFLLAPLTDKIDPATKLVKKSYRDWLESIIKMLKENGHSIVCAHIREDWGEKLEPPEIAIVNDYNSTENCDLIIAYLGNPPSPGVQMELGFAISLKKPILVLHENQAKIPYLVNGISQLTKASIIDFVDKAELLEKLKRELLNFEDKKG